MGEADGEVAAHRGPPFAETQEIDLELLVVLPQGSDLLEAALELREAALGDLEQALALGAPLEEQLLLVAA